MGVDKVDLLFPKKDEVRPFSLDETVDREFLKSDDPNRLAKMALHKVLTDKTTVSKRSFNGDYSAQDLHLLLLVKEFFGTDYAGTFVYGMFNIPPTDTETIQFRQEITKELQTVDVREKVNAVYQNLIGIVKAYQRTIASGKGINDMSSAYYYPSRGGEAREFAAKVTLLYNYLQAVEKLSEVSFNSGLNGLSEHARRLSQSDTFREMAKYIHSFTEHLTVSAQVRITFNEMGSMTKKEVVPIEVDKSKARINLIFFGKLTPFYTNMLFDMVDDFIETNLPDILNVASYLGELEFYIGAMNFVEFLDKRGIPHTFPEYRDNKKAIIKELHNPLLILQESGDHSFKSVPNDVYFDEDKRLYVITGPNDGGKSVYLRATGLAILLAQNGYPIPAREAILSPYDNTFTHFIPKDDIRKRRGRYRQELQQLRYIFENATPKSLVLLDEPCGGTDPGQGSKQSLVTLRNLYQLGCFAMFATHMHNVSEEVETEKYAYAHNLQVETLIEEGKPRLTYRVLPGRAGQSYGDLIAQDVGVDEESLNKLLERRFK